MKEHISIRPLLPEHYQAVKTIYEQGISTKNATFQTSAPEWEEWDKNHLAHSRLVAKLGDEVLGWAALTPVSGRCVYAGVAEVSIYIGTLHIGKGIGKSLLQELIAASEKEGIWTLQAGIFPENESSLRLHCSAGFRLLGTRERIGQMDGKWRDTVLLERRSNLVGII